MSLSPKEQDEYNAGFEQGFDFANIQGLTRPLRTLPRLVRIMNLSRFGEGFLDGLKAAKSRLMTGDVDLLEDF
jgi:hypothetical protein